MHRVPRQRRRLSADEPHLCSVLPDRSAGTLYGRRRGARRASSQGRDRVYSSDASLKGFLFLSHDMRYHHTERLNEFARACHLYAAAEPVEVRWADWMTA